MPTGFAASNQQKRPRPVAVLDELGNNAFDTRPLMPLGYVQVSVTSAEVESVGPVPAGANLAVIKVEGATVRYRDDGTDPTPEVGMPLGIGETLSYDASMTALHFIAEDDAAILNVSFYGRG